MYLHILVSDGCFHENEMFSVSPAVDTRTIERLFRHKVLSMLLNKGKITPDLIALLDKKYMKSIPWYAQSVQAT